MLSCFDAFSKVAVREKTVKAMTIVYAKRTGEYAKIKQVIDSVHGALKKEKISAGLGFDLYYGSPRDVAKEKLRSLSGIILDADDEGKADSLSRLDENIRVRKRSPPAPSWRFTIFQRRKSNT